MTVLISRLYDDYAAAHNAVERLRTAGLSDSAISILASNADGWYKADSNGKSSAVDPQHDKNRDGADDRAQGAATGGGLGVVAGGAVGALAGLGLLAIPGVGPVVAAGWLVATLTGAAAGGATGGIIGALVESGVSKENANLYAEQLRRGGALVTARVSDADQAKYGAVMDQAAVDLASRQAIYQRDGWKGYDQNARPYEAAEVLRAREEYRRSL
jgi:hypothetical protein